MIHTLSTITVRQYAELDRTGNISILKRWWNVFPVAWFNISKFFDSFREAFGAKSMQRNEVYKMLAYNRILMLDAMLKTMSVLMRNQNERTLFALLFKRKAKQYDGNLTWYAEQVEAITGIKVKDGDGLKRLQNRVQRDLDKYAERFKEKEQSDVRFMDIVLGVFTAMEQPYQPEMRLIEFSDLRKLADKKAEQWQKVGK